MAWRDWAGAPSSCLDMLDKQQKQVCRIVDPTLATSLGPVAHRQGKTSVSLFHWYYFGRYSSELTELIALPYSGGKSTFVSLFLDVVKMSISEVSFLAQLDSGILCLGNDFLLPMI